MLTFDQKKKLLEDIILDLKRAWPGHSVVTDVEKYTSHTQVTDRLRRLRGTDPDHEYVCTMARDRIMRLAIQNAELKLELLILQNQMDAKASGHTGITHIQESFPTGTSSDTFYGDSL